MTTKSELNINDHIRRLTYDVSQEIKMQSLNAILETNIINDKTVSAVLIALDDRSENDALRKHGVDVINAMLNKANLPEQRDCIMRHLMTRIFGRYYDETVIGHKELFRTLIHTIERNIDGMDHLFVWLMQEVSKVQEINYDSVKLPYQVAKFFETEHQEDNLRSKKVFKNISNERHFLTLHDNSTPLNTLRSTLELLGERKLSDIDFNLIAAHLSPIINFTHKDAREVVGLALTNIERWAKEFPNNIEEIHTQRVNIYNWFHRPDEHTLDDATLKQLGMNTIFVPDLVAALTKQRKTVCDTAQLFKVLSYFNSIRKWNNDSENIRSICRFILETKNENPKNNFPYLAAIDFLKNHMTGLDVYQPPSNKDENETLDERYRRKLLLDRNLRADKIIKSTLLSISKNDNLPDEIRAKAWSAIILAIPPDLLEILNNNIEQLKSSKHILNSALKDLSNINSIASYSILENLWQQREQFDLHTTKQIALTLGAIGTYDIVSLLLPTVFDKKDKKLSQTVKEVLINQGYAAEIEKETHRRKILALHDKEKVVSKRILEHERNIKTILQGIRKTQADYNQVSQSLSIAVNELDTFTISKKLELADTAIDLAKIKGKIKILLKKVGELEDEIRELTQRLNTKVSEADNVLRQVRQTERDIVRKDDELAKARTNLQKAKNTLKRLKSAEQESKSSLNNLESELSHAKNKLSPIENKVNRLKEKLNNIDSNIRQLERQASSEATNNPNSFNPYKSQISNLRIERQNMAQKHTQISKELSQQNREVSRLSRLINSESSKLSNIKEKIEKTNNNIQYYQDIIPQLERDIRRLQAKHDELKSRIYEINRDVEKYRSKISRQTNSVNQLKAEINLLQSELNNVIQIQKAISESSDRGIQERNSVYQKLDKEATELTMNLNSLNQQFANTENSLQNLKTEKQTLIQQIEIDRGHYDELGDKCNIESNTSNARNENRSQSKFVQNRGDDEIRLGKEMIFKRSIDEFPNRYPSTKKIINKIKN